MGEKGRVGKSKLGRPKERKAKREKGQKRERPKERKADEGRVDQGRVDEQKERDRMYQKESVGGERGLLARLVRDSWKNAQFARRRYRCCQSETKPMIN